MRSFQIRLYLIIALLVTIGACNTSEVGNDLSKKEKQFVSRFQNKLLIKITNRSLQVEKMNVESEEDIVPLNGPGVKPIVYSQFITTKNRTLEHKKSLFISEIVPQILISKYYLEKEKELLQLILNDENIEKLNFKDRKAFINKQLLKYNAKNVTDLLQKISTLPTSLILAQAAIETNWGSSVAFAQANNPLYIISEKMFEPRLKTFGKNDEIIYLKKYKYLPAAIVDYFRNINRQERFKALRNKRSKTDDPFQLVKYLENYSGKHDEKYVELLTNVIKRNNLTKYDNWYIDPDYANEITDEEIAKIVDSQTKRRKKIISTNSEGIEKITEKSVDIQYKKIKKPEDIISIESKYVVPNVYTNVLSLKHLPLNEKKKKFFDMLLPSVMVAAFGIEETRKKLEQISLQIKNGHSVNKKDSLFLEHQLDAWKATDIDDLLNVKMVPQPNSIMMAQAAIETGWGSSRFFISANNTFGVWSFNPQESRIMARESRSGKPIFVRKYDNLSMSIIDYYMVIARGPYAEYREQRVESDDPYEMVDYLFRYSEIGKEYTQRVKKIMRKSGLEKYDGYQIDPKYIEEN
jgi:Bax protein